MCTSIPACKPFFSRYAPALLGSALAGTKQSHVSRPAANSRLRGKRISSIPAKGNGPYSLSSTVFELQPNYMSRGNPKINSKQMLPLSYLDAHDQGKSRQSTRRLSHETSRDSFDPAGESPARTVSSFEALTALHGVHTQDASVPRADSREGLVHPTEQ
jgi:hypothetical protein